MQHDRLSQSNVAWFDALVVMGHRSTYHWRFHPSSRGNRCRRWRKYFRCQRRYSLRFYPLLNLPKVELFEFDISETDLDLIGVKTQEWALVGLNGNEIYSEFRGRKAGYNWPQYSVHRGKLQMLLYRKLLERAGRNCVLTGYDVLKYYNHGNSVEIEFRTQDGNHGTSKGALLVGADGLHSKIRAQMLSLIHISEPTTPERI